MSRGLVGVENHADSLRLTGASQDLERPMLAVEAKASAVKMMAGVGFVFGQSERLCTERTLASADSVGNPPYRRTEIEAVLSVVFCGRIAQVYGVLLSSSVGRIDVNNPGT